MPIRRIVHQLYLLGLLALLPLSLTQCGSFKPRSQKDRAEGNAATVAESSEESEKEESPDNDKEASEPSADQRKIAVDQTPFFRWLRTGLRANAKPTRFLSKGDLVELLKEDEEEKFSRIRLENGKKGWVPSRLLKAIEAEPTPEVAAPASTETTTETPPVSVPDSLTPAEPATLPSNPSEVQPTLKADEISEPMFPQFGIIQPKRTPREKQETKPPEAAASTLTDPKPAEVVNPPPPLEVN